MTSSGVLFNFNYLKILVLHLYFLNKQVQRGRPTAALEIGALNQKERYYVATVAQIPGYATEHNASARFFR